MLRLKLYYFIKPLLPWGLRIAVRRYFAKRKLKKASHMWPIDEAAAQRPANWHGWPDGKQFAFVLTHDVETPKGLDNVRKLAELEIELGFRSSFNFVPEGEYETPDDLIAWLRENGFEVGVHDHRHDGKLYTSRKAFCKAAERINQYIDKWGATGFRSGFMLHNLDWLHDLNIQYDASTFDTDPFEPQPDGLRTIFPKWIPRPIENSNTLDLDQAEQSYTPDNQSFESISNRSSKYPEGSGYLELPYTLPQDSTLFLLFEETSSEIWKDKLNWIADKGGMVLLNTHPDYINFESTPNSKDQYSSETYRGFLTDIKKRYSANYFHALPSRLTHWFKENQSMMLPSPLTNEPSTLQSKYADLKGKRIASLLYSYYPSDPRPRRAAEAMVEAGMQVDMICLRESEDEPEVEQINGVNVERVDVRKSRESKFIYVKLYLAFLSAGLWRLSKRSLSKRYDLVHVHNMPDFLVFGAITPKILGAKIVLDLHDPMPELMRTIYGARKNCILVKALELIERLSIRFSDSVVTVNDVCRDIFSARSCQKEKVHVVINSPDSNIFSKKEIAPNNLEGDFHSPFRLMYHGSLVERNGLGLAIESVDLLRDRFPNVRLDIFGRQTDYLDTVMGNVEKLGLSHRIAYHGSKSQVEIAEEIDQSDLGLISNLRNIFTELNTPTRIFEFLMRGVPVIAPKAPGITAYFSDQSLLMFELGNAQDLADKIAFAITEPAETEQKTRLGQAICIDRSWPSERHKLLDLVQHLLVGRNEALPSLDDRLQVSVDAKT